MKSKLFKSLISVLLILLFLPLTHIYMINNAFYAVDDNTVWHYYDEKTNLLDTFYQDNLDVSDWKTGANPFGYNRINYPDINTIVNSGSKSERYPVTYFKTSFVVNDLSFLYSELSLKYDDGIIVYLNNQEIYRANLLQGQLIYDYTPYLVDIMDDFNVEILTNDYFKLGTNHLSIAVFNNSITSDDLYLNVNLKIFNSGTVPESFGPERITVTFYNDVNTSKAINWFTNIAATNTHLEYVKKTSDIPDFNNATFVEGVNTVYDGSRHHKVLLTNLEPNTTYYYRVGDKRLNMWSKIATFRTLGTSDPITFFHMTDAQGSNEKEFASWKNTLEAAFKHFPEASFFTFGGDMVNNGSHKEQWQLALNMPKDQIMNTTIVPTSGNHDGDKKYSLIDDYFANHFYLEEVNNQNRSTGVYYSLDFGDLHITVLNANDIINKQMSKEQLAWLENDLASTNARWKIILTHKSLYTAGDHYNDDDIKNMRIQIVPLLSKYDVDLMLGGHDHCYYRSKPMLSGEVQNDYEITEVINGESRVYRVDTSGTVYLVNNTANSSKTYAINSNIDEIILNPDKMATLSRAVFTKINVTNYTMILESYIVDDNTGEVKLYDSYIFYKVYDEINELIDNFEESKITLDDEVSIDRLMNLYNQIPNEEKHKLNNIEKLFGLKEKINELKKPDISEPSEIEEPRKSSFPLIVFIILLFIVGITSFIVYQKKVLKKRNSQKS